MVVTVEGMESTLPKNVMAKKCKQKVICGLVFTPKRWIGKKVVIVLMEEQV